MRTEEHLKMAQETLSKLCLSIGERPVGSAGNRAATAFFADTVSGFSFETERTVFGCIDWQDDGATLVAGGETFGVFASPYSMGVRAEAPLVAADSTQALAKLDARDKVLLLYGDIAREQLMPKHFPFYNPEHHQQIVALLEQAAPRALVCASERNGGMAGGLYPFPLIEDGDFDIPSVFMTDEEGARLLPYAGQTVWLESKARRLSTQAEQIVARKGCGARRIVVCAHIDAKIGTPGAIDNGGGTVVLLLLAALLKDYRGQTTLEIVPFNGEDHYGAPGQQLYLTQNEGRLGEIALVINLDGLGFYEGLTAYSLYGCGEALSQRIGETFENRDGFVEGPAWYQGDHAIFVQQSVPSLALTSEQVWELSARVTHTAADRPEIVDCAKLVEAARALQTLVLAIA